MRKTWRAAVVLVILILGLTVVGMVIKRIIFNQSTCANKQGSIMFWNQADGDVEVAIRPRNQRVRKLDVKRNVRACLSLPYENGYPVLRSIYVSYAKKRYKFTSTELLNSFPGTAGARYFMFMTLAAGDEQWESVKYKMAQEGTELDEKFRYVVLSNYSKYGSCWGHDAQMAVVKL